MFVRAIEGRVGDAEALRRLLTRWDAEVRPIVTGFLGATAGVSDDGAGAIFLRFADEASADATARGPEHESWWRDILDVFAEPTVHESSDIELLLAGGSDDAAFVQVVRTATPNRVKVDALMTPDRIQEVQRTRPDLIGSMRVWLPDGSFIEAAYFTNESAAREAESSDEYADAEAPFFQAYGPMTFVDLRSPIFRSA
jgi:hypothetical protein